VIIDIGLLLDGRRHGHHRIDVVADPLAARRRRVVDRDPAATSRRRFAATSASPVRRDRVLGQAEAR
jgi:hypothetical protein